VYQSSFAQTPEMKLMAAVLKDAIDCYLKYVSAKPRRSKKRSNEAEQWFFSDDDDGLYSFQSVCDMLKLDPDYIRRTLLSYKQDHVQAASGAVPDELPIDGLRLAS
jgi:hypothetical protein